MAIINVVMNRHKAKAIMAMRAYRKSEIPYHKPLYGEIQKDMAQFLADYEGEIKDGMKKDIEELLGDLSGRIDKL